MTNTNYSLLELTDLLCHLENLSTCLLNLPQDHVDQTAFWQLMEDQHALICKIKAYSFSLEEVFKASESPEIDVEMIELH